MLSFPKDTSQFSWTRHIKNKMVFYHLSGAQIMRIFRKPGRREEGIAPGTFAAMQSKAVKSISQSAEHRKQRSEEIWIMYKLNKERRTKNLEQKKKSPNPISQFSVLSSKFSVLSSKSRITMISAWRYPGITKAGERPPIPADVLKELQQDIF